MDWKAFKTFFVGNPNAYGLQHKGGRWEKIDGKINKALIEEHLRQDITIGSYYAYNRNNRECCKWICIDIDLHPIQLEKKITVSNSKQIDDIEFPIRLWDEFKKKPKKNFFVNKKQLSEYYWEHSGIIVYEFVDYQDKKVKREKYRIEANEHDKTDTLSKDIAEFLIKFYGIEENNVCREKSGRGYHVWIKLKDMTTLNRAYDFREAIKEKLYLFFGYDCDDLYPKQASLGGLTKGLGNFVKLPLSINRKTNTVCEILDDFNLSKQGNGFEITKLIKKIRTIKQEERKIERKKTEASLDLSKWKPLENMDYREFYKKLRPCLKEIVRGKPAHGTNGHYMRIQLANELFKLRAPLKARVLAFQNQPDFSYETTEYYCIDLENRCRKNNRFFIGSCENIAKRGFCIGSSCPYFHRTRIDMSDEEMVKQYSKEKVDFGVKGGWDEVREIIREKINNGKKSKEYVIKTTRSGTTTNIILETLENDKKILVIAPTIRICEITVRDALALTHKEPELFRFGSNLTLCRTLLDKSELIPSLKRFPFLLKDNCRFCQYNGFISCSEHKGFVKECPECIRTNKERDKCDWRIALEDLDDFDIIYITTAKLHALTKTTDQDARHILNTIFKIVDVIFLDEVSEVLDVGSEGIIFYTEPDPIHKILSPARNFMTRFKSEYEMVRDYIENHINKHQKKIWYALYDFVKAIWQIHKQWQGLHKNNEFIRINSPLYTVIHDLDKWYIQHQIQGSGDKDWLKLYKTLIEYTEATDFIPKSIVEIMILAKFPQFYVQYTNPVRYRVQMEILPAKPIREFLNFVNVVSEKKQFFTTDATEPPIPIRKLFPNITELIINDPMDTARLQTVYPDSYSINISRPRYLEQKVDDIKEFVNEHGNDNTMIIAQNIYSSLRLRKVLKKKKHYRTLTYFRSPSTIGTPSKCRRIITVGSPYPPKNSHRWLADLFLKERLVSHKDYDIDSLTRHLEYYNAKSTFFQAISRGKDPKGITPSEVFCYGLNQFQVRQLLNFPIATPKVSLKVHTPISEFEVSNV